MNPAEKSPEVNNVLEDMGQLLFGRSRVESIKKDACVKCGASVNGESFRDHTSLDEYGISGLCQECQDEIFGIDEE